MICLDLGTLKTKSELYQYINEQLHLPEYSGENLDALYDVLTEPGVKRRIVIRGLDNFNAKTEGYGKRLLRMLKDAEKVSEDLQVTVEEEGGNMEKVILISIDGMRPDGFLACKNLFAEQMMKLGTYTLHGRTVFPSVTLPCHMSLFHSVTPQRHGITTNLYIPFARPINGLFEQIGMNGGVSAMYYGWEPLRDVARPESLKFAGYINAYTEESSDSCLTDMALERIERSRPDFVFLYMVETDEKGGHDNGWMTDAYLQRISTAIENVKRVYEAYGEEYTIIVTADHGGHERSHGSDLPEDMTIPMFFIGKRFEPGRQLEGISILDIAPTIADIMSVMPAREWEGKSIAK